jgi:outer membrane protein OmpA-like peptidoglycan-associated protein
MGSWRLLVAALVAAVVVGSAGGAFAQRWLEELSPIPDADVTISFAADSTALSSDAKAILDRQAAILTAHPVKATLYGHADPYEAGSKQRAWDLGLARAVAARDYLISKGVPADQLRPDSRGSDGILAPDHPDEALLASLRIVTTLVPLRRRPVPDKGCAAAPCPL